MAWNQVNCHAHVVAFAEYRVAERVQVECLGKFLNGLKRVRENPYLGWRSGVELVANMIKGTIDGMELTFQRSCTVVSKRELTPKGLVFGAG